MKFPHGWRTAESGRDKDMKIKRGCRLAVDAAMFFAFLYLKSYRPGRGLLMHGMVGCALFAFFGIHLFLNGRVLRGIGKGRYPAARVLLLGTDFLLFVDCAALAVSSIQMSGDIFSFSPFTTTQTARSLHILGTAWGFVLMAFHMGLHTSALLGRLQRRVKDTFFGYAYQLLFFLVMAAGGICFVKSGGWEDLLPVLHGNRPYDPLRFYGQHAMAAVAVCQLVYVGKALAGRKRRFDRIR